MPNISHYLSRQQVVGKVNRRGACVVVTVLCKPAPEPAPTGQSPQADSEGSSRPGPGACGVTSLEPQQLEPRHENHAPPGHEERPAAAAAAAIPRRGPAHSGTASVRCGLL